MEGWIKIHRRIDDRGWRSKPNTFSLFLYILTNANTEEKIYQGQTIKRGDCIVGRDSLSKKLGISQQSIRTSIKQLKSTSEITIKSTNKFSIITVVGYDKYQIQEKNQPTKQPANQQTTNQQLTTPKEYKNNKNTIKEEINFGFSVVVEKLIKEYNKQRKKKLEKLTDTGRELFKNRLIKLGEDENGMKLVLEQSIENGWEGLFPLKDKPAESVPIADDYDRFKEMRETIPAFGLAQLGLPKIEKDTEQLINTYSRQRSKYTFEDIFKALNKYVQTMDKIRPTKDKPDNMYYKHRFTAEEFLGSDKGLSKRINK